MWERVLGKAFYSFVLSCSLQRVYSHWASFEEKKVCFRDGGGKGNFLSLIVSGNVLYCLWRGRRQEHGFLSSQPELRLCPLLTDIQYGHFLCSSNQVSQHCQPPNLHWYFLEEKTTITRISLLPSAISRHWWRYLGGSPERKLKDITPDRDSRSIFQYQKLLQSSGAYDTLRVQSWLI